LSIVNTRFTRSHFLVDMTDYNGVCYKTEKYSTSIQIVIPITFAWMNHPLT
jgi:hypothetical protein